MPLSGKNNKNHYSRSEYETWLRHYENENYGQGVFPLTLKFTLLALRVLFFRLCRKPMFLLFESFDIYQMRHGVGENMM